ncbi:MAG: hypothetical protein LBJ00_11410 [Planctomycetaceae bacterium]|nr:hypothetical protein [Planctomycetaceae bacterium]
MFKGEAYRPHQLRYRQIILYANYFIDGFFCSCSGFFRCFRHRQIRRVIGFIPNPVWAVGFALEQPLRDAALA